MGPREFAMILVGIGLVSLGLATFEYRENIRTLASEYPGRARSMAVVTAALIALLGVLALLVMLLRQ